MLWYTWAREERLETIRAEGIHSREGRTTRLWRVMPPGLPGPGALPLVVDDRSLPPFPTYRNDLAVAGHIPPAAICNLDPYRPARPVRAAGGVVVRPAEGAPLHHRILDVLVIHRRGVWDLPKGKQDAGEPPQICALREVREEVGIEKLALLAPLGITRHGYVRDERFCVKTTHWYLMSTSALSFTPQRKENIDEVAWMPWQEAADAMGYEMLRDFLHQYTDDAHEKAQHAFRSSPQQAE